MRTFLPIAVARGKPRLKEPAEAADEDRAAVIPPPDTPASATDVSVPADEPLDPVVESYRKLADVFHDVLSEQSLDDLLQRIADTVGELIPYDDITFYEANEATQELRAVFASGEDSEKVLADAPFAYGVGITGWAVEHREPVLANRAELDPRVRFVANTTPDPESLIVVPLVARGRLKGTLNIYRAGFQEFTEDEFLLVVRFGDAAALAIDNAHIRASLERQAQTDPLTGLWNHRTFHERLRQELVTASGDQTSVALIMVDLDDFKRVNDVYSHATGDQVLSEVAAILLGSVRGSDSVCRIGGEEFAIIAPTKALSDAYRLAERVQEHVSETEFGPVGPVSLSIGIASGPEHAANPRELVACAEVAMMMAKARGKGQIVVFHEDGPGRPSDGLPIRSAEFRSIAHLKMLHGASAKLSRLNDVAEIGSTIADELRLLIDYHNCRVFVREGDDLHLVAFRGDLRAEATAPEAALATRVGDGITGHVAATGQPFMTGDAAHCEIGRRIPGTDEIEESLLAVPLRYGPTVVGVIVVSKLGTDQFDADDLRLLEVLAGHASVALVNARLYEAQRREAESAKALLELTRELSAVTNLDGVLEQVALGAAHIMGSERCSVWLPTPEGGLVCRATAAGAAYPEYAAVQGGVIPPEMVAPFTNIEEPFVMHETDARRIGHALGVQGPAPAHAIAVVPLDHGLGALAVAVESDVGARELELLAGIASQARLAITNAGSFATLERTFLSTVEALANALEAKDAYTSSHTRWICDMAIEVGAKLGLDPERLKRVELGALFHDIGKIGIPASILMKAGPLTDEERAVIERHPELGERILAPIEQLSQVRPIVRSCHERFDGRGYPDGLHGDQIPLEARIIFACDAFHAMTTDRPYRDALSVDEAFRRLAEAAGTQFDPRVIEVCLRVLRQPPPLDAPV
jgi:diguanylate cyclase (GGDEF)-like protein